MGATLWYFLRLRPGELRSVPTTKVNAFFERGGVLPAGEDGFVRYAEVVVLVHERRAVEVTRVGYFKYQVAADGTLNESHLRAVAQSAGEAALGQLGGLAVPPGVVQAGHIFARRRMEHLNFWKPTGSDETALRELVNARAGGRLM